MSTSKTPILRRIVALWRLVRRWLSRREWSVRLLGLSTSRGTETAPGVVLIQIDGLSRTQFERALEKGRLPFLRKLVQREGYKLHTLYSGLPATTAAVQAELFYGVKTAVPAFAFRDEASGGIVRMVEPDSAARVERRLAQQGAGLFDGGSAYSNIYSGAAAEPHYCAGTMGLENVVRTASWPRTLLLVIWNVMSLLRTVSLLLVEFGVAVSDCFRGLIAGRALWAELKFIPSRVVVCGLLRELISIGAEIDVTRGLPIVQVNFLGYDEQSHRRGPSSAFAHWSLRRIDKSIERICDAAFRSPRRDFQVWVYADHGQEACTPYPTARDETLHDALLRLSGVALNTNRRRDRRPAGVETERAAWLANRTLLRWLPRLGFEELLFNAGEPIVADVGPLGHVYWPAPLPTEQRDAIAAALVKEADVPFVLAKGDEDGRRVTLWTTRGRFRLPEDAPNLVGEDHPFRDAIADDLIDVCNHPLAGHLVVGGWRSDGESYSFVTENGAHAGPGPEETRAFALLPADAPLAETDRAYIRPLDLRRAVLHALGRDADSPKPRRAARTRTNRLRVMTYNVHACIGTDGKLSPERIARVIASCEPDVVALQELDAGRARTGMVDQAQAIAQILEMEYHFFPSINVEEGRYGNAILSRFPMQLVRVAALPVSKRYQTREPRGALRVSLDVAGQTVHVINTHLGLNIRERLEQVDVLLGADWLGDESIDCPLILCGDLNATPSSTAYRRISERMSDTQVSLAGNRPRSTWYSGFPLKRIDHVFISDGLTVEKVLIPEHRLARVASDHRPLAVDLKLGKPA